MKPSHEFVVCIVGTNGDVHPFIGLALELVSRGHIVHFLSNEYFRGQVERAGLNFVSIGSEEQYQRAHGANKEWVSQTSQAIKDVREFYLKPAFRPAFDYVRECYRKNSLVKVIAHCPFQNGASIAAELLNIPCIRVTLSPDIIPSAYPAYKVPRKILGSKRVFATLKRSIKWRLNDIRAQKDEFIAHTNKVRLEAGMQPARKFHKYESDRRDFLHICMFPEWFAMPPVDWPKKIKYVGFPMYDPVNETSREVVNQFIKKVGQPILFTNGTGNRDVKSFFAEGIRICEALGYPGIFTCGDKNKAEFYALEKSAGKYLHVDFIDFQYVLPCCKAIVHHGGIGTVAQAIRAGIPQIIRPVVYDQPDNAQRVQMLRLGAYIPQDKFSSQNVVPILRKMIDNNDFNDHISWYSNDLKFSNSIKEACNLIEKTLEAS